MAFQIPTLPDLAQRTANAFRSNLKGSDARLWPNNVAVSAKVMAGAVWESFAYLDYIARQIFAQTADGPFLDRHAAEYGMARLPATFAEGSVTIAGDANVAIPAGVVFQRGDGVLFDVLAAGNTGPLGAATLSVRARTAGRTGNAPPGVVMTLTAPLAKLSQAGAVADSGIGLGADLESDAGLRSRVLFRKRFVPHGGAAHDYVSWAREINGVTRVYVDPVTYANGRTSVGLWFLMDGLYVNGIPQSADVARMVDYIDSVRPAGAIVAIAAPIPVAIDMTITLSPDTLSVREAVVAELDDLFARIARVSTLSSPFALYKSKLVEAVSIAAGEDHHTLTATHIDVPLALGEFPIRGAITWA